MTGAGIDAESLAIGAVAGPRLCKRCHIPHNDFVAHDKWPIAFDVRRCECGAVTSYAYEVERRHGVTVKVRLRIPREMKR